MFRRREKPYYSDLLKSFYNFRRLFLYYFHRAKRFDDTPHRIALGFSVGLFVSFTPFLGLHVILAAFLSWILGGNVIGAIMGTFFGNPLTFPFIWFLSFELGKMILGISVNSFSSKERDISFYDVFSFDVGLDMIGIMLAGGAPLGFAAAFALYWPMSAGIARYRVRRHHLRIRAEIPDKNGEDGL